MTGNGTNQPRTVEEAYQGACETSSLKIDEHRTSAGDMIAAAGMNRHRTGLALLRLRSEWASSAHPAPPAPAAIEALAKSFTVEPDGERKGMVKIDLGAGAVEYGLPLRLAYDEAWRWHRHELGLLMMRLNTLPTVRAAIIARSRLDDWGCDEHVIARVLIWWLDPRCEVCGGRTEVITLRGGRELGKVCRSCSGTGLARQGDPPVGAHGKRIAAHIRGCIADAKRELKEGAYRLHRSEVGKQHRGE